MNEDLASMPRMELQAEIIRLRKALNHIKLADPENGICRDVEFCQAIARHNEHLMQQVRALGAKPVLD